MSFQKLFKNLTLQNNKRRHCVGHKNGKCTIIRKTAQYLSTKLFYFYYIIKNVTGYIVVSHLVGL